MFNPTLQSGFGIDQPTGGQPSLIGTIGGLFSDFVSMEKKLQPEQPKLTEDEKFSVAVGEFFDSKPPGVEWNRATAREFIFKHPQFTEQANSYFKSVGVMMEDPIEQTVDKGLAKYADDPEFIVAAAHASSLPEEQREPYMMDYMAKRASEDAEIAQLERDKKRLEAEGTLVTKRWEIIAPRQKEHADNIVSTVLQPILADVLNGQAVELSPEEQAQLGVRYSKIDMNNIGAVIADTKAFLSKSNYDTYYSAYGEASRGMPPKEVEDRIFAGLDAMQDIVKQIDSPQERASALNSLIESNAMRTLDRQGLSTATWMLQNLPPEITIGLLTDSELMGRFSQVLIDGTTVNPVAIPEKVGAMSAEDADKLAKDAMAAIGKGGSNYEMFQTFVEGTKRSGYGVVDGPTFNNMMKTSVEWMKTKAAEDPEAKMYMQEWFVSDINMTASTISRELPADLTLTYSGGRFVASLTADAQASFEAMNQDRITSSLPPLTEEQYIAQQTKGLTSGLTIDDLNKKLASVKLLGPMGQEVIDVIVSDKIKGGSGSTAVEGSAGDDTLQDSIGAKLGINFAGYESKYGLPSGFLEKTAYIESRGNPKAKNPNSSAGGLFQQIDSNAKEWGVKDRFDPVQSTEGAAKFAASNAKYLRGVLGREPTGGELYLAHQQGPGGAAKLLSNPNALAVDIVGEKAVKLNGGNVNMTAGEFANIWISKFNGQRAPMTAQEATGSTSGFAEGRISATEAPTGQVASGAPQVPEGTSGAVVAPLASPEIEDKAVELLDRQVLSQKAKEIIKNKPMDPEVKALIEALIGGAK